MEPKSGVLCLIDLIFDYFSFEDLEKMAKVWKLFWYVATLDCLLQKYGNDDEQSNANSDKNSKLQSNSIPLESSSMVSKNISVTQPQFSQYHQQENVYLMFKFIE